MININNEAISLFIFLNMKNSFVRLQTFNLPPGAGHYTQTAS